MITVILSKVLGIQLVLETSSKCLFIYYTNIVILLFILFIISGVCRLLRKIRESDRQRVLE